jgi:NAD(P)-dependent dehydrogenase (short-subunit alcohol dehydrogenase family)
MGDIEAPPLSQKMHDLSGQVALIAGIGCVGEGWGNGIAIATLFARQGATLFGCDISLPAAERSKEKILAESPKADITVVQGDVTSSSSMEEVVASCMRTYGRIDILINNVGRAEPGDPASMSEAVWDQQISLNLKSVYISTHLVLPIMEKQSTGGAVVNISSVAGLRYIGSPHIAYSTAKEAIHSFTRSTAVMFARRGVRLNTVVPGLINTPLVRMIFEEKLGEDYAKISKIRDEQVPMGRMGSAWDVANAVLFLASREANYITGTEIVVDGGFIQSTGRM